MLTTARTLGADHSVHLTFDDGPHGANTVAVLKALRTAGARATFFVRPRGNELLIRATRDAGHDLAYHCHVHERHSKRREGDVRTEVQADLDRFAELGIHPRAWRTPWGDLARWTPRVAADHGLLLWGWSHDSEDWAGHADVAMLKRIEPTLQGGSVVLLHDGIGPGARRADVAETVKLIGPLCAVARDRGLDVAPLP